MLIKIISILLLLVLGLSVLTFEEYEQFQKENPQNLLEQVNFGKEERFPELEKLMFLTPWNRKGPELTLKYAHKIDYVSPCWYTLQLNSKDNPIFENEQNYDEQFSISLRQANSKIKLVPRVYVDGGSIKFFQAIGSNQMKFKQAVKLIVRIVKQKDLDGFVWDTPYNFYEKSRNSLNQLITELIKAVRAEIGSGKTILFNMANPMDHMKTLDVELYKQLPVNYILIQNYDKGDKYIDMVVKSIEWSKQLGSVRTMLLLPFFTVKVGVGSLSTQQAVTSLKRLGVANARIQNGICLFSQVKSRRNYLIPCLTYFKRVFALAVSANAAVGFWQGGNGLQNYYKFL